MRKAGSNEAVGCCTARDRRFLTGIVKLDDTLVLIPANMNNSLSSDNAALVRRYTEELAVETDLESSARTAQQTLDAEGELFTQRRFDYLYKTVGENVSYVLPQCFRI